MVRSVENARLAAKKALDKPKCFDVLNASGSGSPGPRNPFRVLDTVPITIVNDGTPDLGYAPGSGIDGRIDILPGFFAITFDPAYLYRGYIDPSLYFDLPVVQLSVADMQLVALLHELGHLTGANVHPGDGRAPLEPGEVGQEFNTKIYVNCLDQGAVYQ